MEDGTPGPGKEGDGENSARPGNDPGSGTAEPEMENDLPDRIAHFIRLLSDDDEVTRWRAAESLGRIGDPSAIEPLIDTLWDDDARVRLKAAWALGAIGDMRAIPALRRLYRMEREEAQEIIREVLEEINRNTRPG